MLAKCFSQFICMLLLFFSFKTIAESCYPNNCLDPVPYGYTVSLSGTDAYIEWQREVDCVNYVFDDWDGVYTLCPIGNDYYADDAGIVTMHADGCSISIETGGMGGYSGFAPFSLSGSAGLGVIMYDGHAIGYNSCITSEDPWEGEDCAPDCFEFQDLAENVAASVSWEPIYNCEVCNENCPSYTTFTNPDPYRQEMYVACKDCCDQGTEKQDFTITCVPATYIEYCVLSVEGDAPIEVTNTGCNLGSSISFRVTTKQIDKCDTFPSPPPGPWIATITADFYDKAAILKATGIVNLTVKVPECDPFDK
jgi:hypothetical protein